MEKIKLAWRQFWEDRYENSSRRFTRYVNEFYDVYEKTEYDRKRAIKLLRKEKIELILESIYLFFM